MGCKGWGGSSLSCVSGGSSLVLASAPAGAVRKMDKVGGHHLMVILITSYDSYHMIGHAP